MTLDRPTIAVVIPNYNYSRYLQQTVESVLAQNPRFDQIIVVDDGSTDNSLEVLAQFGSNLTVLAIANGGQLGAIVAGINLTTADYIHTLDADDYALPGLVGKIRDSVAERPAKVQFQLSGVDDTGGKFNSNFPIYPSGYNAASMRRDNASLGIYICPPTSGNVFSRRALLGLGLETFDSRGTIDGSPLFVMPYVGEVVSLNEPLVCYRVHDGNMSSSSTPTIKLINRELRFFHKSWEEALTAIGNAGGQIGKTEPLFVRERKLLIAAMEERLFVGHLAWRFVSHLWRTHIPVKQKLLLAIWGTILVMPSVRVRTYCIRFRRSAGSRPKLLQTALAFFTVSGPVRRTN